MLVKKTPRKIHIIKNHLIQINIHKEIKEKNQERKINREEREFDKMSKINLIYASKLKSNDK